MLPDRIEGVPVFWYQRVSSTMEIAARLLVPCVSGIVVADRQDAGRGRYGRKWVSPPGGLYLSWFFPEDATYTRHLLEIGAVCVVETLASIGCRGCRIKFPNDILSSGKKIAGLLVQKTGGRTILGIGVNLNTPAGEIGPYATSCRDETGHDVDREVFLGCLVRTVNDSTSRCRGGDDLCVRKWADLLLP